uniref:Lipocalin n=1 Tax=Rhipicephalus zambeziensis TaxID=60191 RepID=A0A224YMH4_9ACAR
MRFYLVFAVAITILSYCSARSGLTEEEFINTMEKLQPYWMTRRSYSDTIEEKEKVCVQTKLKAVVQTSEEEKKQDASRSEQTTRQYQFVQSYKLFGCDWFYYTHDATYNVTFFNDTKAGRGLAMHMEPAQEGYGKAVTYQFQFWDKKKKCFVLTKEVEGQKLCELHAWDSAAEPQAKFPSCEKAYKKHCKETTTSREVFTDNCRVNASTWTLNQNQNISGCFQQKT